MLNNNSDLPQFLYMQELKNNPTIPVKTVSNQVPMSGAKV